MIFRFSEYWRPNIGLIDPGTCTLNNVILLYENVSKRFRQNGKFIIRADPDQIALLVRCGLASVSVQMLRIITVIEYWWIRMTFEPPHEKTNKMTFAPSEDSDQPGHPPSLIRVFAVHMKKHWALGYLLSVLRRLCQTGRMPRLIWVFAGRTGHFVGFVMRWLFSLLCLAR